jgi:hypothetical protein
MTKINNAPLAMARRQRLAAALKANMAKRKALAKHQAKRAGDSPQVAAHPEKPAENLTPDRASD